MIKKIVYSIILIVIFSTNFIGAKTSLAAPCGEYQVLKDGKPAKVTTNANGQQITIPIGTKSKYKLIIIVPGSCPNLMAEAILDHPTGKMVIFQPRVIPDPSGIKHEVSLDTTGPEGTYQYRIHSYQDSGNWQDDTNIYFRVILGAPTPDPGPGDKQPGGTGGNTGDTGSGAVTLPAVIDSSVNIKSETDFDEVLGTLFNPLLEDRPENILVDILNILLMLAGILAVIFIILGGFLMVTSAGNETRLRQGKQTLIWAVAGLILTLLSFSIVAIVQSILA